MQAEIGIEIYNTCVKCGKVGIIASSDCVCEACRKPIAMKCICVDYINCNPNPVPNPDCPLHGAMHRGTGDASWSKNDER